jgi:hypothetical protein
VHSAVKPKFETQRWCCSHAKSLHDCNMSIWQGYGTTWSSG